MTNREIRKRAWELFKQHIWRIGAVMLVLMLVQLLPTVIQWYLGDDRMAPWLPRVWTFLLFPILSIGRVWYLMGVWAGDKPDASRTLEMLTSPGKIIKTLGYELAYGATIVLIALAFLLAVLLFSTLDLFFNSTLPGIVMLIVGIPLFIWFLIRVTLAPYCFALDKEHQPVAAIGNSFRASKRSVRRLLAMWIMLLIPYLPYIMLNVAIASYGGVVLSNWTTVVLSTVYAVFYDGFAGLSETGLAMQLIDLPRRVV